MNYRFPILMNPYEGFEGPVDALYCYDEVQKDYPRGAGTYASRWHPRVTA